MLFDTYLGIKVGHARVDWLHLRRFIAFNACVEMVGDTIFASNDVKA